VTVSLVVFLSLAPMLIYARFCNLSGHYLAYDFGTESTAHLKPGAVVFLAGTNWDFVLRGLQYCEDWRTDLLIINRDLMPSAWYRQWVFERAPELAALEIPTYPRGLDLRTWAKDISKTDIPVYWEFTEIDMTLAQHLIPAGHLYQVMPEPVAEIDIEMILRQEEFERHSRFYASSERIRHDYDAQMVYITTLYRAGMFYESRGMIDRARSLFQRALSWEQDNRPIRSMKYRRPASPGFGQLEQSHPDPS
jgi:hypothetical protein